MSCAGCPDDECPADHWHLHVTVTPPPTWSFADVQTALMIDLTRANMRPVVVTNHYRDPARPPYKELIPTKHHKGTEASATRELFQMGVLLNNAGWRVRRLKIEGDPRTVRPGRALYYETHIKPSIPTRLDLPLSVNVRGERIYTLRRGTIGLVNSVMLGIGITCPRVEAAILDTAPEMDDAWINE